MASDDRHVEPMVDSELVKQLLAFSKRFAGKMPSGQVGFFERTRALASSNAHVPARTVGALFDAVAMATADSHAAISFMEWVDLGKICPIVTVMQHAGSVGQCFQLSQKYTDAEKGALAFQLTCDGQEAIAAIDVSPAIHLGAKHFIEFGLAWSVRVTRSILKQNISPVRVEFDFPLPKNLSSYREFFRAPLCFNAGRNAVVYSRRLMDESALGANPAVIDFVEQNLEQMARSWPAEFLGLVEQLVEVKMPRGQATLPQIAAALAMTPRSLQRRLAEEGTDFLTLLTHRRMSKANDYLRAENRPRLKQLAHLLGYSDTGAAGRFLRTKMGRSRKPAMQRSF